MSLPNTITHCSINGNLVSNGIRQLMASIRHGIHKYKHRQHKKHKYITIKINVCQCTAPNHFCIPLAENALWKMHTSNLDGGWEGFLEITSQAQKALSAWGFQALWQGGSRDQPRSTGGLGGSKRSNDSTDPVPQIRGSERPHKSHFIEEKKEMQRVKGSQRQGQGQNLTLWHPSASSVSLTPWYSGVSDAQG